MKLYDIDQRIQMILDTGEDVDPETGEILSSDPVVALEALEMDEADKIEGIALAIKNLLSDAQAIKVEEGALYQRRTTAEGKATRLKGFLQGYLEHIGKPKFTTSRCALSLRATAPSVQITNESVLIDYAEKNNPIMLRIKPPEINKTAVKDAIKAGVAVPGAELVSGQTLIIK